MTEDWCPTRVGEFKGYQPEWLDGDKWRPIPVQSDSMCGAPFPSLLGGVLATIGLFGYSQAMAIAWHYSAIKEARGDVTAVRVSACDVIYDIKANKMEE